MAAKIGILGESTAVQAGANTVYTVPTDKAARIRIKFQMQAGSSSDSYMRLRIGSPGSENQYGATWTSGSNDIWTGKVYADVSAPAGSGIQSHVDMNDSLIGTANGSFAPCFPLMVDYYLSTGDTVVFHLYSNALADCLFQVIGVEDDA